jgi:hypothetical protein
VLWRPETPRQRPRDKTEVVQIQRPETFQLLGFSHSFSMKRPLLIALCGLWLAPSVLAAPKPKKPAAKPVVKPATKPAAKPKPKPQPVKTPRPNPVEVAPVATPPVESGPKTWALLVGVSQYQNSGISSLKFPAKDAQGLREALINPQLGGLSATQVLVLTDEKATREGIMGAVGSFLRPNVQAGDKVVVFLAGHGVAKGAGLNSKSYLLPSDVRGLTTAALENSAVPLRALADDLATLPASQFVVFVDACREDPTPGRGLKGNSLSDVMSRGIAVVPRDQNAQSATFFACSIGQRAFEDPKYGHGVFTNWILEGLSQGAIAQKPDGAIDMGRLSSYVSQRVTQWAKDTSASGDFEVSQTPELIAARPLEAPMVFLRVRRAPSETPFTPLPPRLTVAASPEGAQVSINGTRAGVGIVERALPSEGDYNITVSAPGYAPVSRSVKAMGGYEQQLVVQLEPTGVGGAPDAPGDRATDFYNRATEALAREQWEIAEQGLGAAIGANPKFGAAYEALFDLHRLQNRNADAIADVLGLLATSPRSAQTLSLVSRAYTQYALRGAGEANSTARMTPIAGFGAPKNEADAAKLAVRAATEAIALDANYPAANNAQGYALAALDTKGKNKRAALAAWGKAAFLDPTDATNHLGLGYGIRFYASQLSKKEEKQAELNRAVAALNEAVRLRPGYYEAHRELAFCYLELEDTPAALRECRLARSYRGAASDINEIVGIEVAMSGLHAKAAQNSTGEKKAANEAASAGYLSEAKETAPNGNLKAAMSILGAAGVSTSLVSYLPSELRPLLDIRGTVEGKIREKIPGIGGLRLPF